LADAVVQRQTSVGSEGHPLSCSSPCKFVQTQKGCKDGAQCARCHFCKWTKPKKTGTQGTLSTIAACQDPVRPECVGRQLDEPGWRRGPALHQLPIGNGRMHAPNSMFNDFHVDQFVADHGFPLLRAPARDAEHSREWSDMVDDDGGEIFNRSSQLRMSSFLLPGEGNHYSSMSRSAFQ